MEFTPLSFVRSPKGEKGKIGQEESLKTNNELKISWIEKRKRVKGEKKSVLYGEGGIGDKGKGREGGLKKGGKQITGCGGRIKSSGIGKYSKGLTYMFKTKEAPGTWGWGKKAATLGCNGGPWNYHGHGAIREEIDQTIKRKE